jgi:hypothetical protein
MGQYYFTHGILAGGRYEGEWLEAKVSYIKIIFFLKIGKLYVKFVMSSFMEKVFFQAWEIHMKEVGKTINDRAMAS